MRSTFLTKSILFTSLIAMIGAYLYFSHYSETTKQTVLGPNKKGIYELPKLDGMKEIQAFHREIRTKYGEDEPSYSPFYKINALLKMKKQNLNRNSVEMEWKERGPANGGGRVRGLALDYAETANPGSSFFIGSAGGGVWKTEDYGETWQNLTTDLLCLSNTTIGTSPDNPKRIYAGSGEGIGAGGDIAGCGVFRSDDGGQSWKLLESTIDPSLFSNVTRLIVNPANADEVVVSTFSFSGRGKGAVLKSEDAGETWKTLVNGEFFIQQVIADPTNFETLYFCSNSDGIYKSLNGGDTWNRIYFADTWGVRRIEMAVSSIDPNYLYLQAETPAQRTVVEVSRDGGTSWDLVTKEDGNELPFEFSLLNQGWYDNTVAAHPFDPSIFYIGGVSGIIEMRTKEGDETFPVATLIPGSFGVLGPVSYAPLFTGQDLTLNYPSLFPGALGIDDIKNVQIRYGGTLQQRAHLFKYAEDSSLVFTRTTNVPFQVWDSENNRQLNISVIDQEGDRQWDYVYDEDLPQDQQRIDPFLVIDEDYTGSTIDSLSSNFSYRSMYYVQLASNSPELTVKDTIRLISSLKKTVYSSGSKALADGYGLYPSDESSSANVHVDHHNILLVPTSATDFTVLNANDGGIAVSQDNGASFMQTGNLFDLEGPFLKGLNITQFYGVDKMPGGDRYIGGSQDNGSWYSTDPMTDATTVYEYAPSGDGFDAVWHGTDTLKMIESTQNNGLFRSVNGGYSWEQLTLNVNDQGAFITQIANSDRLPDRVYVTAGKGVFVSKDFGKNWQQTLLDQTDGYSFSQFMTPIAVSNADPLVVWTGTLMGSNGGFAPLLSRDGGINFQATSSYFTNITRMTNIETHPTQAGTAYALFSLEGEPKVLQTKNYGADWEDISGYDGSGDRGFPDVAVYSLLVMPHDTSTIWVGTDIGLIESTDAGASWHLADNGLPNVAVWEMKVVDDQVVIATHGRGIWTVTIDELNDFVPPAFISSPVVNSSFGPTGTLDGELKLDFAYDSSKLNIFNIDFDGNRKLVFSEQYGSNQPNQTFPFEIKNLGKKDTVLTVVIEAIGYSEGRALVDETSDQVIILEEDLLYTDLIDFESNDPLFTRSMFNINNRIAGYGKSLQSWHPYNDNREDQYAVLRYPFVITESMSSVTYDEIVLAEPGEDGVTDYLDTYFYDWFGVTISQDKGKTWRSLIGYDKRDNPVWNNFVNNGFNKIDSNLVVSRTINFLDYPGIEIGDTIYMRFQIHADPFSSDWGWLIDNIRFDVLTPTQEVAASTSQINIYPNVLESNRFITLQTKSVKRSNMELEVYSIDGKRKYYEMIPHSGGDAEYEVKLPRLLPGVYVVRIKENGRYHTSKLIKQ